MQSLCPLYLPPPLEYYIYTQIFFDFMVQKLTGAHQERASVEKLWIRGVRPSLSVFMHMCISYGTNTFLKKNEVASEHGERRGICI